MRHATALTCLLSVGCFALVIAMQASQFESGVGSGLPISTAGAVSVLVTGLVADTYHLFKPTQNFDVFIDDRLGKTKGDFA